MYHVVKIKSTKALKMNSINSYCFNRQLIERLKALK